MRITVVGAILIVAVVAAGVLLLLALKGNTGGIGDQQTDSFPQTHPLQNGTRT